MRTLTAEVIAQLEAEELSPFYILKVDLDSGVRLFTDCDIPLKVSGEVYYPRGFKFDPISYSVTNVVDQVNLTIDDIDEFMKKPFVDEVVQGTQVELKQVLMDSDRNLLSGEFTLFQGEIDAWDMDEMQLNVTVASQFVQWAQQTLGRHSASCRWKEFKGTECGYSGSGLSCDRSYQRCKSFKNTANFGGFRFLPGLMDREIWWGSTG